MHLIYSVDPHPAVEDLARALFKERMKGASCKNGLCSITVDVADNFTRKWIVYGLTQDAGQLFKTAFASPNLASVSIFDIKFVGNVQDMYGKSLSDRWAELYMDRGLADKCDLAGLEQNPHALYPLLRSQGKIWLINDLVQAGDEDSATSEVQEFTEPLTNADKRELETTLAAGAVVLGGSAMMQTATFARRSRVRPAWERCYSSSTVICYNDGFPKILLMERQRPWNTDKNTSTRSRKKIPLSFAS